jgi:hypothetical protein
MTVTKLSLSMEALVTKDSIWGGGDRTTSVSVHAPGRPAHPR